MFKDQLVYDECSLLYKNSISHENYICDEALIVKESIYHEYQEVLNNIHYDRNNIETSGIISYVSVVLNVHEEQHVFFEYFEVKKQEGDLFSSKEECMHGRLFSVDLRVSDLGFKDPFV